MDRRRPEHIRGRQVFLKDLNAKAQEIRGAGRQVPVDIHLRLIVKHGTLWNDIRSEVRTRYEIKAGREREASRDALHEKKDSLCAELQLLRDRT